MSAVALLVAVVRGVVRVSIRSVGWGMEGALGGHYRVVIRLVDLVSLIFLPFFSR